MASFVKWLFGDTSQREIRRLEPILKKIDALEEPYKALTDEQLKGKTAEFKARLAAGETLDDLLPEAFAAIREADFRVLGQRPFRVQLMGGIILHQGRIAEMRTGEGKTLTSTLPAYLNALTGKGVHIVTVNDYLARYQGEWMGKVYRFMGLSCGVIVHGLTNDQRRAAYACDVTYGTNNEIGFDYLRDNMAIYKQEQVQRGHNFAIVDEVDSILIDEARTPLIISGQGSESTVLYEQADRFALTLKPMVFAEFDAKESMDDLDCDYVVDEKAKRATLTPRGAEKAERYFKIDNLNDPEHGTLQHHINQAIKARGCMKKEVDYIVKDGQIVIVDEFTGRLMFGRRYSDGLHQAIEAKEGVKVMHESKTLATITFQNFFRLYSKLSGMTGTALTEEDEFRAIYKLDVIEVPTNKPMIRNDLPDEVYMTEPAKYRAIIAKIKEAHAKGQPVLVGTVTIEKSELLSHLLKREGIPHSVLNAKQHEKEASIVAQAGKPYAVTIATNMAGRGTDIMLGGNADYLAQDELRKAGYPEEIISEATGYADSGSDTVLEARALYREKLQHFKEATKADADFVRNAGGLCILGTERHESRRIDNQLRGRAGRQGDPGESCFYLSLEDDLMRLFGSERIAETIGRVNPDPEAPISAKLLSGAIENAQKKVEGRNFQSRKRVLEYDNVNNQQRELIYQQRAQVLEGADLKELVDKYIEEYVTAAVLEHCAGVTTLERFHEDALLKYFDGVFVRVGEMNGLLQGLTVEEATQRLLKKARLVYAAKEQHYGPQLMRELERVVLLRSVDRQWMDHIDAMQELRRGISLSGYGQVNPVDEYKKIGFDMFSEMIAQVKRDTARAALTAIIAGGGQPQRQRVAKESAAQGAGDGTIEKKPVKKGVKVGRNDPCPCGSGKKYKHCCWDKDNAATK